MSLFVHNGVLVNLPPQSIHKYTQVRPLMQALHNYVALLGVEVGSPGRDGKVQVVVVV